MRYIFSLHIWALLPVIIFGSENPTPVKSEIHEVTVFLAGAQVTRMASVGIEAGTQTLVFQGLPQNLNPQSIQVKGTGNFTILSVTHQVNYLMSREKTTEIRNLEDSLEHLRSQLSIEQVMLRAYTEEENFLLANKQIGGQNTGVKVDELKVAADLFRSRLIETGKLKIRSNLNITSLNEKINRINNQLSTLNSSNAPTSEVLVNVTSKGQVQATLNLSYLVQDAGWVPEYDLRATDVRNPVELTYKGSVFQKSNENWKNVRLTLSTGNPALTGTKPELSPWYLSFQEYRVLKSSDKMMEKPMAESKKELVAPEESGVSSSNYVEVETGQTTTAFVISIPYTIPTDGKKYEVEIQKNNLNAGFEYQCVPKLDPDVFLVAKVTGWEDLNLLSGSMNLFFEGTFVGKSFLNTQNTQDTLDISLGRDKNIVVKRERKKEFTNIQVIGSNRKETRAFDISIRNNKKQDIGMVVFDQVPVSTNKDISVNATEISGAALDKESGKLSWKFSLKSAGNKTFRMAYEVKYPKDKKVILE